MDMERHVQNVEKNRSLIFSAEDYLWRHPETGYKEWKASAYLEEAFEALGYNLIKAGDIPGFYTDLDTGRPGPCILVMAELDALVCETHPEADPETKSVHCCGHHAQCAALLGVAAAMKEPGAIDTMCGVVRFMVVPAEEMIELEYRETLRQQGLIKYYGGKTEFMHRGYMDGVDMAVLVHVSTNPENSFTIYKGMNGCLTKRIAFEGIAAHAGGAPHKGINALYAATQGLAAVNALRETLLDEEHVRVHPIITSGGTVVNAIPDMVRLECFIRGITVDSMIRNNNKVNRALCGSAAALGAKLTLHDRPGYSPQVNDTTMISIAREVMEHIITKERTFIDNTDCYEGGSSDLGDVSCVMPVLQVYIGGAVGVVHGNDYNIPNAEKVCVKSAKFQIIFLEMLLRNNAEKAKEVLDRKTVPYTNIQEYFTDIGCLEQDIDAVTYLPDNKILIQYATSKNR